MNVATHVGWCPGALRPMRSGDGLLVRVKPHGGVLSFAQASGLAHLAERCGNGQLDLTGRANLQIRGGSEATLGALHDGLAQLGLLDPNPATEAVRNIVASPLARLDLNAVADIRPLLAALTERLAIDPVFRLLPPKWSMVVDDGGSLSLDDVAADLRFVFSRDGSLFLGLGDAWASITVDGASDALSRLAHAVAAHQPGRMRDLMAATGPRALLASAGLAETPARPAPRAVVSATALLGVHADNPFVGAAPPFGSLRATDLDGLVNAARRAGAHDLRLTPWRVLLVTFPAAQPQPEASMRFVHDLAQLGFVVDGADRRLQVVACTGAPGCHRATTPTRPHAAELAATLGRSPRIRVHVSGCAKGCARPAATAWTLVGRDGAYDLVRDGSAGDAPIARGLSFAEAAAWLGGAIQVDNP